MVLRPGHWISIAGADQTALARSATFLPGDEPPWRSTDTGKAGTDVSGDGGVFFKQHSNCLENFSLCAQPPTCPPLVPT